MNYLIGIDLGTTAAKCVIYDEGGGAVAERTREMEIKYPRAGEAEQDALSFYRASCALIRECLESSRIDAKKIAAVGIDSQMGGIMGIDRNYNPVTYYDTPLDSRSAEENRWMHERFGELIIEKNGSISTFGNKILYWKKKREWDEIYRFVQPSAHVAGMLAGLRGEQAYMDETFLCFSGLSDLEKSKWSEELCGKLGVPQEKLPRIVKSTEIIGTVCGRASTDTGLPRGIPICAGCGDQVAGFVGAGILKKGQMADVAGTACIFAASVDRYTCDLRHRTLSAIKSPLEKSYYLCSVVLGGRTHRWFIDEFFTEEKNWCAQNGRDVYHFLDEKAALLPPGSDGLIAIDYLQGRFFPPDPYVRGLFIGHSWAHKKIHFYRSILESIAYDHYLTKEIIEELVPELRPATVTAIGSGAQSELWMQIKADVLQLPYQNLHRSDLSTLGAALLAGHAVGVYSDIESAAGNIVKLRKKIRPMPGRDASYAKYIEVYRELFGALKDIYAKLSS